MNKPNLLKTLILSLMAFFMLLVSSCTNNFGEGSTPTSQTTTSQQTSTTSTTTKRIYASDLNATIATLNNGDLLDHTSVTSIFTITVRNAYLYNTASTYSTNVVVSGYVSFRYVYMVGNGSAADYMNRNYTLTIPRSSLTATQNMTISRSSFPSGIIWVSNTYLYITSVTGTLALK